MQDELRQGRRVVFRIYVHLVFVPKYRRKIFDADALDRLKTAFSTVCGAFEATLDEFNGERDHVHLRVQYPPKASISALVNSLKEFLHGDYAKTAPIWPVATGVAACGQPVTLRLRAAVRLSKYCANILSNNAPLSDRALRGALYIPALMIFKNLIRYL